MKRNFIALFLMLAVSALAFKASVNAPSVKLKSAQVQSKEKNGDDKITICHLPPGNPQNRQTITISVDALSAHKAHGDFIGSCDEEYEVSPKRPY